MNAAAHRAPLHVRAARMPRAEGSQAADSVLCVLLGAYLVTLAFEGPLRYALALAGLPDALYVRDAIPAGSLLFLFCRAMFARGELDLRIAVPASVLALHAAYAALMGVALFSIAFGIKIFMFIPYGVAMWPLVRKRMRIGLAFMVALFAATLAGVLANFFAGTLPWEGLEYTTAFGATTTTRTWWIPGGIARLPGFTRTSFNAAMILGITGVLAMVYARRQALQLLIAAAGLAGIVLTTSKGMILAFPVAAAWLVLRNRWPLRGHLLVGVLCAVTFALPPLVVYSGLAAVLSADELPVQLMSVWERFSQMWPEAFALLPDGPAALLGGGPGSIGTPQAYGASPHLLNAADNIAVFMLVSLGLPGLFYCAIPALGLRRVAATQPREVHAACAALLMLAYGYGMSISMIEESFFSIMFGLCLGAVVAAPGEPS
jgi:hypothetical protein